MSLRVSSVLQGIKKNRSSRIVDIPLKTWDDIGDSIANQTRTLVRDRKVLGGSYSTKYAQMKGSRKFRNQSSTSTKPDLTLTGKMLQDFQRTKVLKDGIDLGLSNYNVQKYEANQDRGWDMLDDSKVLEPIAKNVNSRISQAIDKNIKTWASEPIRINIGK